MKFLTVIIPVYNGADYLRKCVHSVLSQPFQNLNIIIVDDGSTDGSPAMIEESASVIVLHQENKGVSAARNTGIDYCILNQLSEYIMFLDADDLMTKNFLTDGLYEKVCESYPDACSFAFYISDQSADKASEISCVGEGKINRVTQGKHISSFFYKTELLDHYQIRFPESVGVDENIPFNFAYFSVVRDMMTSDCSSFIKRMTEGSVVYREGVVGEESRTMNPLPLFFRHGIPARRIAMEERTRLKKYYRIDPAGWLDDIAYLEGRIQGLIITAIRYACMNDVHVENILLTLKENSCEEDFAEDAIIAPAEEYMKIWESFISDPYGFKAAIKEDKLFEQYLQRIVNHGSQEYMREHFDIDLHDVDAVVEGCE